MALTKNEDQVKDRNEISIQKLISDILTLTEVLVNQKRVNLREHRIKFMFRREGTHRREGKEGNEQGSHISHSSN